MDNQPENENSLNNETGDQQVADISTETVDVAALQAQAAKVVELEQTNRQLFERAKKAEGFVKVGEKWVKAPKAEEAVATVTELQAKTGELSETQLDYLDLKGINNEEDIAIIQRVMQRTGQTVRQALADDYVKSKLEAAKATREVQNAMPSSTKRGGGQTNDLASAVAKFEQDGTLPDDFDLRSQVVNKMEQKSSKAAPSWRR